MTARIGVAAAALLGLGIAQAEIPAGSLKVCSARVPDGVIRKLETLDAAGRETTKDGYHPELAALKDYTWGSGHQLHIRFMGGTPAVQRKLVAAAKGWERTGANVRFLFDDAADAEIRIAFDTRTGSWSEIGTEAKRRPGQATMNFGWLTESTPDEEYSRVVLHEFGHALGCIHEHQSPDANIKWKKDAVYSYYKNTNNWDRPAVDQNIFYRFPPAAIRNTKLDPASIMMYAFPPQLADGFETGWNRSLSQSDIDMIKALYP